MEYYDDDEHDAETTYCSVCGLAIAEPSEVCGNDCDIFCDVCVNDVHDYFTAVVKPVMEEVVKLKKVD